MWAGGQLVPTEGSSAWEGRQCGESSVGAARKGQMTSCSAWKVSPFPHPRASGLPYLVQVNLSWFSVAEGATDLM